MWDQASPEAQDDTLFEHGSDIVASDAGSPSVKSHHNVLDNELCVESKAEEEQLQEQSITSHIRVGPFDIIVRVCRPTPMSRWPDWKLHLAASDGSSFNIDSQDTNAPHVSTSLIPRTQQKNPPIRPKTTECYSMTPHLPYILNPPLVLLHDSSTRKSLKAKGLHSAGHHQSISCSTNPESDKSIRVATSAKIMPSWTDEEPNASAQEASSLVRIVPSLQKQRRQNQSVLSAKGSQFSATNYTVVESDQSCQVRCEPVGDAENLPDAENMDDGGSSIAASSKRNLSTAKGTTRKASRIKYDIRWADPDFYTESQRRQLTKAQWPERRDPLTHLPVVYCHKCYLENHRFEQCETTYPKGRWVYWRHFKCGASYIRGHVFPPHLVSQWVKYHVNKQAESSNRRSLRNASL